jgi:chemotaxis-related protein WspB
MLYLLFAIGDGHYAIAAREVVEVLPLVEIRPLPRAPLGVVGLFDYHGLAVPVVDLSLLVSGTASQPVMTTRIAVVRYIPEPGVEHLLGLIAEHLTDTVKAEESDFQPAGVSSPDSEYLGRVVTRSGEIIQRINLLEVLPPAVRSTLFQQAAESL